MMCNDEDDGKKMSIKLGSTCFMPDSEKGNIDSCRLGFLLVYILIVKAKNVNVEISSLFMGVSLSAL